MIAVGISLDTLRTAKATFAADRDWHQFHAQKILCMALSAELGELTELFQWLTAEESSKM